LVLNILHRFHEKRFKPLFLCSENFMDSRGMK